MKAMVATCMCRLICSGELLLRSMSSQLLPRTLVLRYHRNVRVTSAEDICFFLPYFLAIEFVFIAVMKTVWF